jgi:hypothetical protein
MRFFTLALFAIMAIAVAAGMSMVNEHAPGGMWVLSGSAAGLLLAYFINKRVEQRGEVFREGKLDADMQRQLAKMQQAGYAFSVRDNSGWFVVALLLGTTGIALLLAGRIAIGLGVLIFAVPACLQGMLLLGQPLITFSPQGIQTPIVGAIPWDAVLGVDVKEVIGRRESHYILRLYVPTLRNYFAKFSVAARMLYFMQFWRSKTIVTITLEYPDQDPELVERVARQLWFASTGREYLWDPDAHYDADQPLCRAGEFARDTVGRIATVAPAARPFTGNASDINKESRQID